MLKIRHQKLTSEPPGGWTDTEPVSGITFRCDSLQSLVNEEMQFLVRNGRMEELTANFGFIIQDRVCRRLSADWVYDPDKPTVPYVPSPRQSVMSLNLVNAKTERVQNLWERGGRKKVRQVEADARAGQCANCELNRNVGCLTCNGVYRKMESFMGACRTPHDKRLQACAVDNVFLKVKVWLTEDSLRAAIPAFARPKVDGYPSECWHRKILEPVRGGSTVTASASYTEDGGSIPPPGTTPSGSQVVESASPVLPEAKPAALASAPEQTPSPSAALISKPKPESRPRKRQRQKKAKA